MIYENVTNVDNELDINDFTIDNKAYFGKDITDTPGSELVEFCQTVT